MDFNQIDKKIMQLKNKNEAYHQMVSRFLKKYEQEFSLKYAHESTVIEGNTCSYDEARKILYGIYRVDPGATDRQREVYEIRNHANTFLFLKDKLLRREPLDEDLIREMHRRLVENIWLAEFIVMKMLELVVPDMIFLSGRKFPFRCSIMLKH